MLARLLAALLLFGLDGRAAAASYPIELRFARDGQPTRTVGLPELTQHCTVETVTLDDPYYQTRKSFRACPLAQVLGYGFGQPVDSLRGQTVIFRARDGYAKPTDGGLLAEPGGYLAFADADRMQGDDPGWQPIDRKQVDPGPFYIVWTGPGRDPNHYPWPYQLSEIAIAPLEQLYPHIVPADSPPDSPARAGYAIFKSECIACHAINGEGGTVGPELNVPLSIVEYRPAEQINQYIRNPFAFRYTSMPPHPHLTDQQLDALVAYFTAMRSRKHDPRRQP